MLFVETLRVTSMSKIFLEAKALYRISLVDIRETQNNYYIN